MEIRRETPLRNGLKCLEIVLLECNIVFVEDVSKVLNEESTIGTIGSISYNLSGSCNAESVILKNICSP